jgi:predicted phage-related endonuclease
LESVIIDKFTDEHPDLVVHRNVGTWRSTARPFQLANPDALFQASDGSWGVVEVKTARYPDDWANGVPVGYQAQVQWYLQTFGLRQAWVVVLFSGSDYQEFLIEADDFVQGVNLGMVEQFLTHLDQGTKPDWDGATSTLETQRKLHPEIDDTEVELGELGQALESALAAEKSVASATNVIKCQILDLMGTAKKGTIDGEWAFTRQAKGQGTPFLVAKRGK